MELLKFDESRSKSAVVGEERGQVISGAMVGGGRVTGSGAVGEAGVEMKGK